MAVEEDKNIKLLLDELNKIRDKFIGTAASQPLNNQRLSSNSRQRPRIRVIHEVMGVLLYKFLTNKKLDLSPIDKGYDHGKEIEKKRKSLEFKSSRIELLEKDELLIAELEEIEEMDPGDDKEIALFDFDQKVQKILFKKLYNLDITERKVSPIEIAKARNIDTSYEILIDSQKIKNDSSYLDNTIETLLLEDQLARRLNNFKSRYESSLNETGSSCVYLTCGNISYKESESSDKIYNSPILLLRLKIEKNKDIATECKKYKFSEDNANLILNRSLSKTLEKKFGITLNEFDSEEFGDHLETPESTSKYIESYFKKITNKIKGKTELKFSSFCTFDTFNTTPIIQWNDCSWENWEGDPLSLDSLKSIIFGQENKSFNEPTSYDEISLDKDNTYREDIPVTILKSDVSQHAAIVSALKGESIVLQGPPGTGKSQTIANLIMHLCLSGKTVLFMAAKQPALKVVHKKLEESHHHDLCTMFDTKKKRETFYEDIKEIIELKKPNLNNKTVIDKLESDKKVFLDKVDFSTEYYKKTVEEKIINIEFLEKKEVSLNFIDSISLLNTLKSRSEVLGGIERISSDGSISNTVLDSPAEHFFSIKKIIEYIKDNNIYNSSNFMNDELYNIKEGVKIEDLKAKINDIQNLLLEYENQLAKIKEFNLKKTVRYHDLHNLSILLDAYHNINKRGLNKDLLDIILLTAKENQDLNLTCSTFSTIVNKFSEDSFFNRNSTYRFQKLVSFYVNVLPTIDPSIHNLSSEEGQMYDIEVGQLDNKIKDINNNIAILNDFDRLCETYDQFFKKHITEISSNMIDRKLFYEKLIKILAKFTENQRYFRYLNDGINYKVFNDFFDQGNVYEETKNKDSEDSLESYYLGLKSLPLTQYLNEIITINGLNLKSRSFSSDIQRKIAEIDDNIKENTSFICKIKSFVFFKNFKEIRTTVPIKNIKDHEIERTLNLAKKALNFIDKFYKILMSNRKSLEIFLKFADLSTANDKDEPSLLIDWISSDPKDVFEKMIDFAQIININKKFEDSINEDFNSSEQAIIYNILNDDALIDSVYENQDLLLVKPLEIFERVSEMVSTFESNKNLFLIDRKPKYLVLEFNKILDTFLRVNDNSEIFDSKIKLINVFSKSKDIASFINTNLQSINILKEFIFSELISEESKKIIKLSKHLSLIESVQENFENLFKDSTVSSESLKSFIKIINTLEKDFSLMNTSYGLQINRTNLNYLIEGRNDISFDYVPGQLDALKEIEERIKSTEFLHILNIKNLIGKNDLIVNEYLNKFNTNNEICEYAEDIFTCIYLESRIKNHLSLNSKLYDNENYIKNINDFAKKEDELIGSFKKKVHLMQKLNKLRMPDGKGGRLIKDLTERQLVSHVTARPKTRISIHQFMKRAFESMSLLTPCFIADPSAVSMYFKQEFGLFDVVIMDEASQIKIEDSIPTLARGKQFIIAGDSEQLPPTNFFTASEKEDKEEQIGDVASLLEIANSRLGLGKSSKQLLVHYRSKYSELIKFSNEKFYNNRLVIPPSTETIDKSKCIEYTFLDKDKTDYKQGGTNIAEVLEIIKYLENFTSFEENLTYSILIGTSNKEQKELLQDAIDKLEADSDSFRRYRNYWDRAKEGTEKLIIQNLESIQGDERDVVILSTVYGPERGATAMRQNFGPINREGGYKRLNVIITRQRLKLVVFTSMLSSYLTESEHMSKGKAALKDWLKYLETGLIAIRPEEVNHETESYFEESVKIALESNHAFKKYEKHTQVKQSGFRIDMALYDREKGEYVLGIECDGAAYHSSKTAKDRDRNRQEILEFKGWKIHRIWSTDWFKDPKSELDKLEKRLISL